jgi:hypothetical protein
MAIEMSQFVNHTQWREAMIKKLIAVAALLSISGVASAAKWRVEITNVTPGQSFTPILVASHYGDSGIPGLGAPASEALAMLAEAGATGPLGDELLAQNPRGTSIATLEGLLEPGQTVETYVDARPGQRLTLAAMLVPTNDTFFAIDSVFLPLFGETSVHALAYDAGSEANSQSCADMPGPRCEGEGFSPIPGDGDEGFVHVSNGFHDLGTVGAGEPEILTPAHYTWNNPVAVVTIRRVHSGH